MTRKLTITRPDDWHLHVRDGAVLNSVVPATAACFGRAIIMPNLAPPVTDTAAAMAYRDRIRAAAGETSFEPLMTLYLTESTTPDSIREAKAAGVVAAKL
ncbi:MAG: dihydroorotase, partial [Marinobacter sp.]